MWVIICKRLPKCCAVHYVFSYLLYTIFRTNCCFYTYIIYGDGDANSDEEPNDINKSKVMSLLEKGKVLYDVDRA